MHNHCCLGYSAKFKPVTHVIFDLDGTILDSEHIYATAIKQTVESLGAEYYPEFINKVKGSIERRVAITSIEEFKLEIDIEEFLDKFHNFSNEFLSNVELMPGVERMVLHLKKNNIPIAIATSSNQEAFKLKSSKYQDFFSNFHHIVCGGTDPDVKNSKPAPDIFLVAASRFEPSVQPSQCLVFEDSQNGVTAALTAGMQVVMIPEPDIPYEVWKQATLRIDSFNFMVPGLFGLPDFPQEELSPVFTNEKVEMIDVENFKRKVGGKARLTIRDPPIVEDVNKDNQVEPDEIDIEEIT